MDEKEFLRQLTKLVKMLTGDDVTVKTVKLYSVDDEVLTIDKHGWR